MDDRSADGPAQESISPEWSGHRNEKLESFLWRFERPTTTSDQVQSFVRLAGQTSEVKFMISRNFHMELCSAVRCSHAIRRRPVTTDVWGASPIRHPLTERLIRDELVTLLR